jgi:aminotransferase
MYMGRLKGHCGCGPAIKNGHESSYYLIYVKSYNREELAMELKAQGIYTTFRYFPLHLVRYYRGGKCRCPVAEEINEIALNLPLHQNLSDEDVEKVIECVNRYV